MAIVKNSFRVSRLDGDAWRPGSRGSGSDDEGDDGIRTASSSSTADGCGSDGGGDEVAASDVDSGMGSDEFDLSELGEPGTEFCQVGNQSCSLPLELHDLPGLGSVLSLETWNECLSEEERFALAEHLPDMDQETFAHTLAELLSGANFHFGSPLAKLFTLLKGGLCDPRVVLNRRGINFFQWRQHYHQLREYHNSMVGSLVQIRNAWEKCAAYGIEERLQLLNILRSQSSLRHERDGGLGFETDSESGDSAEQFWKRRLEMGRRAMPLSKLEQVQYGKENTKGLLKAAGNLKVSASSKGYDAQTGQYLVPVKHGKYPRQNQIECFDLGSRRQSRNQARGDEEDYKDQGYEMSMQGDWNTSHRGAVAKAGLLKSGKKHELQKRYGRDVPVAYGEEDPEGYAGSSHSHGRSRNADQKVTIASYDRHSLETPKKIKYPQEWTHPVKDRMRHQVLKGAQADLSAGSHPIQRGELKTGKGKTGPDTKGRPYKNFPAQMDDSYRHSDHRASEKMRSKSAQKKGMIMEHSSGNPMFAQSEETESDSSDQAEGEGDINPLMRKIRCLGGAVEGRQPIIVKSSYDSKKGSSPAKVDKKAHPYLNDGDTSIYTAEVEPYSKKGKQKGKTSEAGYSHDVKSSKKAQLPHPSEKLQPPSSKTYATEKKRKGMTDLDYSSQQLNYMRDYGSGILDEDEEDLDWNSKLADAQMQSSRSGNRNQTSDTHVIAADRYEMPNMSLVGCSATTKRRKGKSDGVYLDERGERDETVHQQSSTTKQSDDADLSKKGKRKANAATGSLAVMPPEPVESEKGTADVELETKPQKKPFTLITPSIHTGFSFSIIHLLSAVRKALITPHVEDTIGIGNHLEKDDGRSNSRRKEHSKTLQVTSGTQPSHFHETMDANTSEHAGQNNLPSLTVQEIANRVRSNPGDPCILETQEPLQDLVRGVLKIFASKTAPLGAKGWKALVFYEKENKSWTWVGPVSASSSDNDTAEEETSSEAWGIPHKMLVKLVDAFANWLKSGQETLQQIGSLPAPPISLLPNLDEKERFKDLRAQKSLNTINPTTDEMKAYFRQEEHLRYSVPDRAFSYTAYDGKKSIVAPLRRGGGKPTSKARDHFMLKADRPPHVTILCLVRDAAARLPGSIGTRADVCTLIRDSQYIVEDVSDAQVNQVVSGALDRLHYERDPCVQFDSERKLWVYLHREREEEDFEDDGTSSTKKWKKQKKDAMDNSDTGAANDVNYPVIGDPAADGSSAGYDHNPDLNVDSSSVQAGEQTTLIYNGLRSNMEDIQSYIDSAQGDRRQGNSVSWEVLGLNPLRENKMLCQENSTNEDFDDETFSRERHVGLLSASLL